MKARLGFGGVGAWLQRAVPLTCLLVCGCVAEVHPEVRIIAVGDSITGTLTDDTYLGIVATELGWATAEVAAETAGGRTTTDGLARLTEILELGAYPNAELLIYFLGGFDILEFVGQRDPGLAFGPSEDAYPFTDQFDSLLNRIRVSVGGAMELAATQNLTVVVATYFALPVNVAPCDAFRGNVLNDIEAERANEYIDRLNEVLLEVATKFDLAIADLRPVNATLVADPDHFIDCNHPSSTGAAIIADQFVGVLQP